MASAYDIFPRLAPIVEMERDRLAAEKMEYVVGYVQELRDDGKLPDTIAFGQIARALTWLAEERVIASHRSGELAQLSELIKKIERTHGLGPKDFWPNGEGPPEWQALNKQFDRRVTEIIAELMREHGEIDMAKVLLTDPDRFDRLCTAGRRQRYDA